MATTLRAGLAADMEALQAADRVPSLVSLQVGASDPSRAYLDSQRRACAKLGILYNHISIDAKSTTRQVAAHVRGVCLNPEVTGLILQLPVPDGIDVREAYRHLDPRKDVEGMHPANLGSLLTGESESAAAGLQPCTALAVLALIRASGVALRGAEVCVVGHSDVVGKPIGMLLLNEDATVTTCHVHTAALAEQTRRADVLVVAAGKPGLIGSEHVKPGAVVIDVGINYLEREGPPVGDVRAEVAEVAGWLTPVPGGVGPVTVAMLLRNTIRSAQAQRERVADWAPGRVRGSEAQGFGERIR